MENTLLSEYPTLEFSSSHSESEQDYELEILRSTFEIVWNHYSISYQKYKEVDEQAAFNKNLNTLREELDLAHS